MPAAAPRIDTRLIVALHRLHDRRNPIAETHRRLGLVADHLSLPRPSYEQTRILVHAIRRGEPRYGPGELLLDIAFRVRPPEAILDLFVD